MSNKQYRKLYPTEVVQKGDEIKLPNSDKWAPCYSSVGSLAGFTWEYRRPTHYYLEKEDVVLPGDEFSLTHKEEWKRALGSVGSLVKSWTPFQFRRPIPLSDASNELQQALDRATKAEKERDEARKALDDVSNLIKTFWYSQKR